MTVTAHFKEISVKVTRVITPRVSGNITPMVKLGRGISNKFQFKHCLEPGLSDKDSLTETFVSSLDNIPR